MNGSHTLAVRAVDALGQGARKSLGVVVDTVAPGMSSSTTRTTCRPANPVTLKGTPTTQPACRRGPAAAGTLDQ
jgi:hypothetical protein